MPSQGNTADILKQIGANVPEALQGMMPKQMGQMLTLKKQMEATPTTQTLYQDPEKRANLVLSMWNKFNSCIQGQGGQPVGLMELVSNGGFAPDIQQMFSSLFAPGAGQ
jgi:hypothetical protein